MRRQHLQCQFTIPLDHLKATKVIIPSQKTDMATIVLHHTQARARITPGMEAILRMVTESMITKIVARKSLTPSLKMGTLMMQRPMVMRVRTMGVVMRDMTKLRAKPKAILTNKGHMVVRKRNTLVEKMAGTI